MEVAVSAQSKSSLVPGSLSIVATDTNTVQKHVHGDGCVGMEDGMGVDVVVSSLFSSLTRGGQHRCRVFSATFHVLPTLPEPYPSQRAAPRTFAV